MPKPPRSRPTPIPALSLGLRLLSSVFFITSAFSLQPSAFPIMAQKAEIVQVMMTTFFITRYSCKHWPKRVSWAFVSSMFY